MSRHKRAAEIEMHLRTLEELGLIRRTWDPECMDYIISLTPFARKMEEEAEAAGQIDPNN